MRLPGRSSARLSMLAPWVVPLSLIALWQFAAQVGWLSSRILPEPWAVAKAFRTLAASGELWDHLGMPVARHRGLLALAPDWACCWAC